MLKKRDGATTYIPGVFMQADILREVHVKIEGSWNACQIIPAIVHQVPT